MPREEQQNPPDDRIRVQHMLDAARHIIGFMRGRTRGDLDTDPMLSRAIMNALGEIGEAAARTSDVGRARVVGLPWGQIVETRNIIVHVYWGVDRDKIWRTVTEDIPVLIDAIETAVKEWPLPRA